MPRGARTAAVIAAFAVVALPTAGAAIAALSASVGKKAQLVDNGAGVMVEVTVTCPAGSQILESFVYVVQDGNTSPWSHIPVVCDGVRRTYDVRVRAEEFVFRKGKARVSGYVLLTTGESVSPTREVKIHKK